MGKIYLIESKKNGCVEYKIGITSRSITKRLHQMQTGNPATLKIINHYETDNYEKLEVVLHNLYKRYNVRGEWFSDKIDIDNFLKDCEFNDNLINSLKKGNNHFV